MANTAKKKVGKLPVGRVVDGVDPDALCDIHPLLRRLFQDLCVVDSDDAHGDLIESLEGRQYRPILVAGEGCVSAPGMILDGRRLLRAAKAAGLLVRVEYIDGLDTPEAEEELIIHANLSSALARFLDERMKAALEHYIATKLGSRKGERSDLTSVHGARKLKGETAEIIAASLREDDPTNDVSASAIRERALIFYSPIAPEILKDAVNTKKIPRRQAADMIRAAQKPPAVAAELHQVRDQSLTNVQAFNRPAIGGARNGMYAEVEKVLRGGKPPKASPRAKVLKATNAEVALVEGEGEIENFLGHRVTLTLSGSMLILKDAGEAFGDERTYRPMARTTRTSWLVDVKAALDYMPGELRSKVQVGEVEHLDPMTCPTCNGTLWRSEGAGAGTCPKCVPIEGGSEIRTRVVRAWELRRLKELVDGGWVQQRIVELIANGKSVGRPVVQAEARSRALEEARAKVEKDLDVQSGGTSSGLTGDRSSDATDLKKEIRAALDEAVAKDPRLLWPTACEDLRYPRQRIRLTTPEATVDVVLWEKLGDATANFVKVFDGAGLRIGRSESVHVGTSGGLWHSRCHMRNAVYRTVMKALHHEFPSWNWWMGAIAYVPDAEAAGVGGSR